MKEMTLKAFPYKWTCLIGVVLLGTVFWMVLSPNLAGALFLPVMLLLFLVSSVFSLGEGLGKRSKASLYRILINVLILALLIPVADAAGFTSHQIFLHKLPRYQEVTDLLAKEKGANPDAFETMVKLPPNYADLADDGSVLISYSKSNVVTAMYFSGCSTVLHHQGYLYRSNGDIAEFKKSHPELGFVQWAPNWYFWAD